MATGELALPSFYDQLVSLYQQIPDAAQAQLFQERLLAPEYWMANPDELAGTIADAGLSGDTGAAAFLALAKEVADFRRGPLAPDKPAREARYNVAHPPGYWTDFLVAPDVMPLKAVPYPPTALIPSSTKAAAGIKGERKEEAQEPQELEAREREEAAVPTENL